jgi:ubiquinone/menaquinone biosynthesis C-methylase UbiE
LGLYAKYVLPRLIDRVMRDEETARLRAAWVPRASGNVLEIGIGSGLNLPFYSADVRRVYGVEPSLEMQRLARGRASTARCPIELLAQSAEAALPLDGGSIDTVVVTWSLCSIPDPPRALGQMRRVLKPEGRLIFLEHGLSPDAGVAAWQNWLTPLHKRIGGGCHLNRRIDALIGAAGFRIGELTTGYQPGPRPFTYTYQGIAHPSGINVVAPESVC